MMSGRTYTTDSAFLARALSSNIAEVCIETPLELAPQVSRRVRNTILLKREDMQVIFAHKIRGAYAAMSSLPEHDAKCGIVTGSAGNFALASALAAQKLKYSLSAVVPVGTAPDMIIRIEERGARVVTSGQDAADAAQFANEIGTSEHRRFLSQTSEECFAAYGTIADEIIRRSHKTQYLFVPVGSGATLIGVARFVNLIAPEIKVVGVQLENADQFTRHLRGRRRTLTDPDIFCVNAALRKIDEHVLAHARRLQFGLVRVSQSDVKAALIDIIEDTRAFVEPDGALALAGAKKYILREKLRGKKIVAIVSGANGTYHLASNFLQSRELAPSTPIKRRIFISYSRVDQEVVRSISMKLERHYEVWVDFKSLKGGERWEETIRREIHSRDKIIVFLSAAALSKRGYFQSELRQVVAASDLNPDNRIFVVPVRLDPCDIPSALQRFHAIDQFDRSASRFLRDIRLSLEE